MDEILTFEPNLIICYLRHLTDDSIRNELWRIALRAIGVRYADGDEKGSFVALNVVLEAHQMNSMQRRLEPAGGELDDLVTKLASDVFESEAGTSVYTSPLTLLLLHHGEMHALRLSHSELNMK